VYPVAHFNRTEGRLHDTSATSPSPAAVIRDDEAARDVLERLGQQAIPDAAADRMAELSRRALSEGLDTPAGRNAAWRVAHGLALQGQAAPAAALTMALGASWPADARLLLALAPALAKAGHRDASAALAHGALGCIPGGEGPEVSALAYRAYRCLADAEGLDRAILRAQADTASQDAPLARCFAAASLFGHARRHAEALAQFAECRRRSPERRDYAIAFCEASSRTASTADAVAAMKDALQRWPNDPSLLFLWSRTLKTCGRIAEATTAALSAIATGVAQRGIYAHAIGLLVRAGADDSALDLAEQALAMSPPELDLGPIGLALKRSVSHERARCVARRLLQLAPSSSSAPALVEITGRLPVLSREPVRRRLVARGEAAPPEVFAAFSGKGHALHGGSPPLRRAPDVELLDMEDVTLHVFPYGFAVTDRQGDPHDLANPILHTDLVEYARRLPFIAEIENLILASDGKFAANNYCHWLLDYLPRILWAEKLCPGFPIGIPAVTLDGFRASTFAFLGFDTSRLMSLKQGNYRIRRFAMLSNCEHSHFKNALHGGNLDYAAPLLAAFPQHFVPGSRRLFLTRSPGAGRSFTNYDDVITTVKAQGFEIIDPGRHSFAEQVKLFGEAAVVAGPHGAALTNLLFCPPGTRVLEIFPQDAGTLPFAMLSAVRQHHYTVCVGEAPHLTSIPGIDGNRADFNLKSDILAASLADLLDPLKGGDPS